MDLQLWNVDSFIIIMMILMILRVGLQLVESVERGFGEEKAQIGACEPVRMLRDVIAIRRVQ